MRKKGHGHSSLPLVGLNYLQLLPKGKDKKLDPTRLLLGHSFLLSLLWPFFHSFKIQNLFKTYIYIYIYLRRCRDNGLKSFFEIVFVHSLMHLILAGLGLH